MEVNWTSFKSFIDLRNDLYPQYVTTDSNYFIWVNIGSTEICCFIPLDRELSEDTVDFEDNYKSSCNVSPNSQVTTQYEKNDKDLKLAKASVVLDNNTTGIDSILVPGEFGSGDGRYVAGGYAISSDFHVDDYITVRIEDSDRVIAWILATYLDPGAQSPLSDEDVIAMGTLPAPFNEAFPNYPVVKSYTDDELSEENRGWYFWPLVQDNNTSPAGECEVEPIGGYGFIPSGFYIILTYKRASLTSGRCNVNIYWGKKN